MVDLVRGLGNGAGYTAGFGEQVLLPNDDGSSVEIDIRPIFENGLNFYGNLFGSLYVNNNGSVTFQNPRGAYTPTVITEISNNPEITPFFADVDTRNQGELGPTPGGNSQGTNLVFWDLDRASDRIVVTWDDVGFFSNNNSKKNAFQLILQDRGGGNFDIEFRYEDINWTTGNASGGTNGLGGTVARAGWTAGTGNSEQFFELPQSGDEAGILSLDEVAGNTGVIGLWRFEVRSGEVRQSFIPDPPPTRGFLYGDPHLTTLDGLGYSFQAVGEYTLMQSLSGDLRLQARFEPAGENVSFTTAVAALVEGNRVMVDIDPSAPLRINGTAVSLANDASVAVGSSAVFREDNTYTIVYAGADGVVNAGDDQIRIAVNDGYLDVSPALGGSRSGQMQGLLGNFNGNAADDLQDGAGVLPTPIQFDRLYGSYRDHWRVSEGDSLFSYDAGESNAGFFNAGFPTGFVTINDLDPAARAAAEEAVRNAGISPGSANYENAVIDFALTGNASVIRSAESTPLVTAENQADIDENSDGGSTTPASLEQLFSSYEDTAEGLASAYQVLLSGVPNQAGFQFLIQNAINTNYGAGPGPVFNPENIFINLFNNLVQGNSAARTQFDAIAAGNTLAEKIAAIYQAFVPASQQTPEGLAFITRPEGISFYEAVAAERGVAGTDGAAIVAMASLMRIIVNGDYGIGDAINDLSQAVAAGSHAIPATGTTLTDIETADGAAFDTDDAAAMAYTQARSSFVYMVDDETGAFDHDSGVALIGVDAIDLS